MAQKIGFGTGCLYKIYEWASGYKERIALFSELWCTTLELNFATQELLKLFTERITWDNELQELVKTFDYVAIHAPWDHIYQHNEETDTTLQYIRELQDIVKSDGIVIHADVLWDPKYLSTVWLPFLVENMQKRKNENFIWTFPEYFSRLNELKSFDYVLDLQHAYEFLEEDPQLHSKLAQTMWDKLWHLHVSWFDRDEHHTPVYMAENKVIISDWIKDYRDDVIILEWVLNEKYAGKNREEIKDILRKEYEYIKKIME
jgi:SAM-dependent methyltransferase